MCDHDDRRSTRPPPPPEPIPRASWGIKKTQEFLKGHGYILLAQGPFRTTFYPKDVELTPDGLIPEGAKIHLAPKQFAEFVRQLGGVKQ
jgi:hypothetical protein